MVFQCVVPVLVLVLVNRLPEQLEFEDGPGTESSEVRLTRRRKLLISGWVTIPVILKKWCHSWDWPGTGSASASHSNTVQ